MLSGLVGERVGGARHSMGSWRVFQSVLGVSLVSQPWHVPSRARPARRHASDISRDRSLL